MFRSFYNRICKVCNSDMDVVLEKTYNLSESDLDEYQSYTFLSKKQIKRVYWMFTSMDPDKSEMNKNSKLLHRYVLLSPMLRSNPFKDRLVKIFSSEPASMYFEEFLEMMSVFSPKADLNVKAEYAFRIYNFGEDDMLGPDDLRELLHRLQDKKSENQLSAIDIEEIVENVMAEGDVDNDGYTTFPEFKHMIQKCPDFVYSFSIRC